MNLGHLLSDADHSMSPGNLDFSSWLVYTSLLKQGLWLLLRAICPYYGDQKLPSRLGSLVLGDFNHVSLKTALPRYREQIFTATRGEKILDQCFCVIPWVFHTVVRAALEELEHTLFFSLPSIIRNWKPSNPIGGLSDSGPAKRQICWVTVFPQLTGLY